MGWPSSSTSGRRGGDGGEPGEGGGDSLGDVGRFRGIGGGRASSSLDEGEAGRRSESGEDGVDGRPAEVRQERKKLRTSVNIQNKLETLLLEILAVMFEIDCLIDILESEVFEG